MAHLHSARADSGAVVVVREVSGAVAVVVGVDAVTGKKVISRAALQGVSMTGVMALAEATREPSAVEPAGATGALRLTSSPRSSPRRRTPLPLRRVLSPLLRPLRPQLREGLMPLLRRHPLRRHLR